MNIKKVMFSGPKESNNPDELIKFVKSDEKIRMGIYFTQRSSKGNARYDWVKEFATKLGQDNLKSSLQIGYEWCEDFCNGKIAPEIQEMMNYTNQDGTKTFNTIQLNFYLNQHNICKEKVAEIIKNNPAHRFILAYNTVNQDFIDALTYKGIPFDVLYKPFSEIEGLKKNKDFFAGRVQGYSDEFSPDNISKQLDTIMAINNPTSSVYIDIYKAILDENENFCFNLANEFMRNINSWVEKKSLKKL